MILPDCNLNIPGASNAKQNVFNHVMAILKLLYTWYTDGWMEHMHAFTCHKNTTERGMDLVVVATVYSAASLHAGISQASTKYEIVLMCKPMSKVLN